MARIVFLSTLAVAIAFAQSPSAIEGVVLDGATGQPMPRVKVVLRDRPDPEFIFGPTPNIAEVITDGEGRFTIESKPGRYRVVPIIEGFVFSRPPRYQVPRDPGVWVRVAAGQRVQNIQLRMVREAVITGRVLDENGQPIPGTAGSVMLVRPRYDEFGVRKFRGIRGVSYPGTAESFVRMDDRGEFRLYGLHPGDYYLSVSGSLRTYYPGTLDETQAAPIHIEAGEEIRLGTITRLQLPVKTVQVRFHFADDGSLPAIREVYYRRGSDVMLVTTSRGDRGVIVVPSVAPGRYDMQVNVGTALATGGTYLQSRVTLDVADSDVDREINLNPGVRIASNVMIEDANGRRSTGPRIGCRLRSDFVTQGCTAPAVKPPGFYRLELQDLPPDAYILSATVGGRDILTDGIQIDADTNIDIVLGTGGGVIEGTVTDSKDTKIPDAIVALVPDAPKRTAGSLYRSVVTDIDGAFDLRGITPGTYRLFAWSELEGAAYRNAEFMEKFEARGTPVRIEGGGRVSATLKVLDESEGEPK